jgi:uncharacterized protein
MTDSDLDEFEATSDQDGNRDVKAADCLGELVQYIAGELVDEGDEFEVLVDDRGSSVAVTLVVAPEIMGRMIGRHGRIAKAMRTAVMVSGSKHNVRGSLDIEERLDTIDPNSDPDEQNHE